MKFIKTLVLPALALTPTVSRAPKPKTAVFTTFEIVGSFNSDTNYVMEQGVRLNSSTEKELRIDYYRKSDMVKYASLRQECGSTRRTFQLDVRDQIEYGPVYIDLMVYDITNSKTFYRRTATLVEPERTEMVVRGRSFSFPYVCFGVIDGVLTNEESYDFSDSNEYITTDHNSKLDLSEFRFSYSPINFYKVSEAYLEIIDYENIYPNITKADGDNTIRIPLSITKTSGSVGFDLNLQMYVNQTTLDMSSLPRQDYVATNSLYVPLTKQSKMSNNEISIVLHESGFDLAELTIPLTFILDHNYFGFCDDSDNCIHGGVRS